MMKKIKFEINFILKGKIVSEQEVIKYFRLKTRQVNPGQHERHGLSRL